MDLQTRKVSAQEGSAVLWVFQISDDNLIGFLIHVELLPLGLILSLQVKYQPAGVEFVNAVTAGGSVKFVASGVNFSIFTHFLCFFLLKLLKLGEIDSVNFFLKIWRCKILDKSHV